MSAFASLFALLVGLTVRISHASCSLSTQTTHISDIQLLHGADTVLVTIDPADGSDVYCKTLTLSTEETTAVECASADNQVWPWTEPTHETTSDSTSLMDTAVLSLEAQGSNNVTHAINVGELVITNGDPIEWKTVQLIQVFEAAMILTVEPI